ncbi:metallophosphoesterase [Myxosarcina sp. GI1]|uniref:metallophosphoesterase n=1 Tax=Myxosarcina sp. GI1 TaxID=1541065 RepID=UPI00055A1D49|nr:metallophosphoesterase [Myxosarcina sp. GI1]
MAIVFSESLKVERIAIAIASLPDRCIGTKIVQLSDLHYDGICLSEELLERAIALSNREQPDLVVITGDFITDDPTPIVRLADRLKNLKSKNGIYGCLSNHDVATPYAKQAIVHALADVGIKVLSNEVAYPCEQELAIVRLADYWSSEFNPKEVFTQIAPDIPRIVLSHNPDSAAVLKKWRVDLQLSGHTHGGQVVIPGYGEAAPILLQYLRKIVPKSFHNYFPFLKNCSQVVKYWQWSQGWHQIGRNQLYINRGLGSYPPGRIFCPPELSVITLEA